MSDYEHLLPPRPELIPPELRRATIDNTMDWSRKVPPQAVGMFVAAVTQWLSDPRFGVKVTTDVLDDGWNLRIELPKPDNRNDVVLPDD